MFLVAGLGNPGVEYALTPHNLGFLTIDRLAERHAIRVTRKDSRALMGVGQIAGREVMLAQPQTFMNLSGDAVSCLISKDELDAASLIVISDDLALPFGSIRLRQRGSAGGHNGLKSIIGALGTNDPLNGGTEYLLAPMKRSQLKELDELVGYAADAVYSIIAEGVEKAMTKFNRRAPGLNNEDA